MEDSAAYWGAVLQVVPVLSLGTMIEFRYLFKRVSDDNQNFEVTRGVRAYIGASLLVVTLALTTTFLIALVSLNRGGPADGVAGLISIWGLSAAAGGAVASPGLLLFWASTGDFWVGLHRRMPWSTVSRLRREGLATLAETAELRSAGLEARHYALLRVSRAFVEASRSDRDVRSLPLAQQPSARADATKKWEYAHEGWGILRSMDAVLFRPPSQMSGPGFTDHELTQFRERLATEAARIG